MSRWIDGFNDEGFPWCPEKLPCTPGDKKYCTVCKEAVRQMNFMEGAIISEKKRHDATFDKVAKLELQNGELKNLISTALPYVKARGAWKPTPSHKDLIEALEKAISENLVCEHKWAHIEDHHVICEKCKHTADLCWTCESEKTKTRDGGLVCLKCQPQ